MYGVMTSGASDIQEVKVLYQDVSFPLPWTELEVAYPFTYIYKVAWALANKLYGSSLLWGPWSI